MRQLLRRVWYIVRQRQLEAELAEEMEFHRAMSKGRDFGNATRAREESRAVWIWPWLESLWQDGAYALRNLRRQPGFTTVVVVVLGTVIGLHTTLLTVLAGVMLRPWPGMSPVSSTRSPVTRLSRATSASTEGCHSRPAAAGSSS